MSSLIKNFFEFFFYLSRDYQQEIPLKMIAELSRDYTDKIDDLGNRFNMN